MESNQPHPLESAESYLVDSPPAHPPGYTARQRAGRERVAADPYYTSPGADNFHNAKPPSLEIIEEKPEHRLMVFLKAQGLTNGELAERMNYSHAQVSQITRQPWWRARFAEECKIAGRDAIEAFLKGEALPSLEALVEIRDNPEEKGSARVAAANSILDRAFGKPTQHIKTEKLPSGLEAQKELVDIQRELEVVKAQQQGKVPLDN